MVYRIEDRASPCRNMYRTWDFHAMKVSQKLGWWCQYAMHQTDWSFSASTTSEHGFYPLVNIQKAIENCNLNMVIFFIVPLVYQRGIIEWASALVPPTPSYLERPAEAFEGFEGGQTAGLNALKNRWPWRLAARVALARPAEAFEGLEGGQTAGLNALRNRWPWRLASRV